MGGGKEQYSGLAVLKAASQLTFRPVCQTESGNRYFEFCDLGQDRTVLVCECVDEKLDVRVRDRYGIIRYCIFGAFDKTAQLDVYINSHSPIGVVKNGVIYDAKKRPMFKIYFGSEEWCSPSGRIMIYNIFDNTMVAEIIPKANEFSMEVATSLPAHCKALILATIVQIAFSRFGYMQQNLPRQSGEMLYETEETVQAVSTPSDVKPVKEANHDLTVPSHDNSLKMLDMVSELYITASGRNSLGLEFYEVRTQDNKIILTFERTHGAVPEMVAKDTCGEVKFTIMGKLSAPTNEVRTANGNVIGLIQPTSLQDEHGQPRLYYKPCKDSAGYPVFNIIRPGPPNNVVATVSHNRTFVTLSIDDRIDSQLKAMIIALCIRLALQIYQINSDAIRNVNYMYRNYESMYKPKSTFATLEMGAAGKHSLGPLRNTEQVRVRGAGYNVRGVHYYEIIDVVDDKIKMTIECLPNEGQSQIKDRHGNVHIQVSGLWLGATDMFIRLGNGFLLGIIREHIFLDREEKCILVAKPEPGWEADNMKCPFLIYADSTQDIKATVIPEVSTMLIKMDAQLELSSKATLFAFAMRLFVKVYRFHKIPIPLVDYHYIKDIPVHSRKEKVYRFDNMLKALSTAITSEAKGEKDKMKTEKAEENKSMLVQVIIDKDKPPKPQDPSESPMNIVALPGQPSVRRPTSVEPSPRVDPFPTLHLFKNVVNICIRPIGEDKDQVKYFKIIDLEKNRSFLTCECISPAEDLCFKQRYGLPQFYLKGAFLQKESIQLYINPGVIVGNIEGTVITNHRKKVLFYTSKPVTLCGPPTFKVSHIQSNQLMGRIFSLNSEVIININSVCAPQQKALILAFALNKAFTAYGMAKLANQRVNYQYVTRKSQSSRRNTGTVVAKTPKQRNNKTSQSREIACIVEPAKGEPLKIPDGPAEHTITRFTASVSNIDGIKVNKEENTAECKGDKGAAAAEMPTGTIEVKPEKDAAVISTNNCGNENHSNDNHAAEAVHAIQTAKMNGDNSDKIPAKPTAVKDAAERTEAADNCNGDQVPIKPALVDEKKSNAQEDIPSNGKTEEVQRNSAFEEVQATVTVHRQSAPSVQTSRKPSLNRPSVKRDTSDCSNSAAN